MCVEAAVCYALGQTHGDQPDCVGYAVNCVKIMINDRGCWLSDMDRAKGMRRLAVAQLGSRALDQYGFAKRLVIRVVNDLYKVDYKTLDECVRHVQYNPHDWRMTTLESCIHMQSIITWNSMAVKEVVMQIVKPYMYGRAMLNRLSDIIIAVLTDMDCPGCEFLPLCDGDEE